jgi:transposase
MGKTSRRKFTAEFKAKVAIEALRETSTLSELAKKYELAPEMISRWKSELMKNAGSAFETSPKGEDEFEKEKDRLHRKIGELEMEVDFCKRVYKKLGMPIPAKK